MGLDAEVIVVGGGPAGAATAARLAGSGRDVLVLEKGAFPREKPCGEYYNPGVVAALERLGALDAILAAEHKKLAGMRLRTERSSFLLDYPEGSDRGWALGVRRLVLDHALLEHARSCGARVVERERVLGVEVEGGRVRGVRLRGASSKAILRSRFVVGADGRHSAVSRSLGLEARVRWPRRLGLHAHYAGVVPRFGGLGEMHVGSHIYCGLAPVGNGLVVVGLVEEMGQKPPGEPIERYLERRLGRLPGAAALLEGARRVGPVRGVGPLARRVRRVAGPGYLLAGDAAGFFDPFTGEGVYRALREAELAAEAIEGALRAGSDVPEGYAGARRTLFSEKQRLVGLVQLLLQSPVVFGYALSRLEKRPLRAGLMKGALGDYRSASQALRPSYLWSLLQP